MFDLEAWQWVLASVVTVMCVGYMSFTIARMLSRRAVGGGVIRHATPLETGLVGALPEPEERVFDCFSYRVTARYAGRARVVVRPESVTVAGPRAPRALYVLWVWLQGLTLALVPPALVLAVIALDWRWLVAAVGTFIVSSIVMAVGAGVWPGMGETIFVAEQRFDATEVPLDAVRRVTLGTDWARDGLRLVIAPYAPGIDGLAARRAVCWNAPDGGGRDASWAVHMLSDDDADALYALLSRPDRG
jgi:hypothetical protein